MKGISAARRPFDANALAQQIAADADPFRFGFDEFHAAIDRHDPETPAPTRLAVFTRLPRYLQRRAWHGLAAELEARR